MQELAFCEALEGWARVRCGDPAGLGQATRAVAELDASNERVLRSCLRTFLADACLEVDDRGAFELLERARAEAESRGERWWLAETLRLLAEADVRFGDGTRAVELLDEAESLATKQGARVVLPRIAASRARPVLSTGVHADATPYEQPRSTVLRKRPDSVDGGSTGATQLFRATCHLMQRCRSAMQRLRFTVAPHPPPSAEEPAMSELPLHARPEVHSRRWFLLGVLCLSLVMIVMAVSSLNVALPTMQNELDTSATMLQWIVDAYALVFAGLLLTAGALGDRFGRKGALLVGLGVFALGALVSGLANSAEVVIVGRAVQGAGAAFVMPATLSLITAVFPPAERQRAIAIWVGFAGAGGALGPIVAGALLERYWWGSAFLVNVPVVVAHRRRRRRVQPTLA